MKMMLRTLLVLSLGLCFNACASRNNQNALTPAGESAGANISAPAPASGETAGAGSVTGRANNAKVFRGTLGQSNIEMRLMRDGENLSGAYFYEGRGQDLTLKGRVDASGKLSLQEFDPSGKQTGKFDGKWVNESDSEPADTIDGEWSRPDGKGGLPVSLTAQHIEFTGNLQIVSRTIKERKPSINASYPQITGGDSPGIAKFNQQAQALVTRLVKEFKEGEPEPDRSDLSTSYNVMLATDDLISVEIMEDAYAGGAHPDSAYYALNYDLRTGRELELKDLFKQGADYKRAIQQYALKDLNARAKKEAQEEHRPPEEQAEDLFSPDQVSEWSGWAMTRRGVIVYFDFPHVIAFFSREFIPAHVLKDQLDPTKMKG